MRLRTTPDRLRAVSIVLVIAALMFGLAVLTSTSTRSAATASTQQTEAILQDTGHLYVWLADADSTVATTFVTGGIEPAARRTLYLDDISRAGDQLAILAGQVGTSGRAGAAIRVLSNELPVYNGLIATARADNRADLPLGAGYLRQASITMRTELLGSARTLYEIEAGRLLNGYRSGTSGSTFVLAALAGIAAILLFLAAQFYLARRSRRILNVPLVVATVLIVGLLAWVVAAFSAEQGSLDRARASGSDAVEVLSAARILASRAQGDESLSLVSRGQGAAYLYDFDQVAGRIGGKPETGGLLGVAETIEHRSGSSAAFDDLSADLAAYLRLHHAVNAREARGNFPAAVQIAVGPGTPQYPQNEESAAQALDTDLSRGISLGQARFTQAATQAESALRGLRVAALLIALIIATAALIGLQPRIAEYR